LNTKFAVLIVSPPGDLQIGLQALLTVHLDVDVLVVGKGSFALKVIEMYEPSLVILDQDIPGNTVAKLLHNIKSNWPEIICVVLANEEQGRQILIDVGADLIIIKGLPGLKFINEIKRVLDLK